MLEKILRNQYQYYLVDPLSKKIYSFIPPLSITIFSGILGLIIIPLLYFKLNFLAIIILLLSGYLDTLDGTIARLAKKTSSFGSVMDILMDRLVEFSVILGIFLIAPHNRALSCLLMLGSILFCITSFLLVGIFSENNSHKGFYYSEGLIERAEAFIFFSLIILCPSYFLTLSSIFIMLVLLTTFIRLIEFYKNTIINQTVLKK